MCQSICRAEWKFFSLVKKIKLFERSEFLIFRDKRIGMRELDSLSSLKPRRELFRSFFAVKKGQTPVRKLMRKVKYQNKENDLKSLEINRRKKE